MLLKRKVRRKYASSVCRRNTEEMLRERKTATVRGLFQQSPRDAEPLLLASRNIHAALPKLSFRYYKKNHEKALNDISFTIKPGQTVGIIGSTGSGKTTPSASLIRFEEATALELCKSTIASIISDIRICVT